MATAMTPITLWGELPLDAETEPGIAAIEREQITKPRPMELDGPLLHQPVGCNSAATVSSEAPIECSFGDPLIMHTIHLNQHAKKMRSMLNALKQESHSEDDQKQCEDENEVPFLPTLPVMEFTDRELTHKRPALDRCFESEFRLGIGKAPPEINEQLAKKILRKALAVVCAHTGFETTTESILEILVDVTSEFYLKLTRLLRANVDREALYGGTNFPDVLEETFYGVGIGSLCNLISFYQTRVIDYHDNLLHTCRDLSAKYRELKSLPDQPLAKDTTTDELKQEIKLEEGIGTTQEAEVPQIVFPAATEDQLLDAENNQTEESVAVTALHLEELTQLQVAFEQETGGCITSEHDDGAKAEQTSRSDLILQLATNTMPNLYGDEEIVNVIDSPSQPSDTVVLSISDPHLSAMLDQPHTPVNLDMKLFKGSKSSNAT